MRQSPCLTVFLTICYLVYPDPAPLIQDGDAQISKWRTNKTLQVGDGLDSCTGYPAPAPFTAPLSGLCCSVRQEKIKIWKKSRWNVYSFEKVRKHFNIIPYFQTTVSNSCFHLLGQNPKKQTPQNLARSKDAISNMAVSMNYQF